MFAFGPKRTLLFASHTSAFRGKADMTFAGIRFRGRDWGESGYDFLQRGRLLLTQSGHAVFQSHLTQINWKSFGRSNGFRG
jgi:hypothetical protein